MKKNVYLLLAFLIAASIISCKNQDDIYMEFVKKGGNIYPEKTNNLKAFTGYKRVKLVWNAPKDPSVKTAKVYWNNKTDVMDIDYSTFSDDQIEIIVDGLEEKSYTFQLVNFDAKNNPSMTSEITVAPYAENWLLTHTERTVISAEVKGSAAEIVMSFGTNEMITTKFRYIDTNGETVELDETMDTNSNKISLPDAISGNRFEFSSSYCPAEGLDTIWSEWTKSPTPIAGLLDCKSWKITVTNNQIWDANFLPSNVVDGFIDENHRWRSAQGALSGVFPKIMVADAQKDSYYINKVSLYQNQVATNRRYGFKVEIYWGNEPFDPDAGSDYVNSPGFADAIAKGNWQATTFWFGTATWTKSWPVMQHFRYFAVIWKNSRAKSGQIDLWEMRFYGYNAAED